MKRRFLIISVLMLGLIVVCVGCKKTDKFQNERILNVVAGSSSQQEEENSLTEFEESVESIKELQTIQTCTMSDDLEIHPLYENEKVFFFPDQDFSQIKKEENKMMDGLDLPRTYQELMDSLGENGVIVIGHAVGIREAHVATNKTTLTDFSVERVLYGNIATSKIKIQESYCPIIKEDTDSYIYYFGNWKTMLKNDRRTLLYLKPSKNHEGIYLTCYYELPLPEDYAVYDPTYLAELLDFYRGKQEMIRMEETTASGEEQFVFKGAGIPVLTNTDEEMLAMLDDHILVQTATRFQIKIWPKKHIRYSGDLSFFGDDGIYGSWSRPKV